MHEAFFPKHNITLGCNCKWVNYYLLTKGHGRHACEYQCLRQILTCEIAALTHWLVNYLHTCRCLCEQVWRCAWTVPLLINVGCTWLGLKWIYQIFEFVRYDLGYLKYWSYLLPCKSISMSAWQVCQQCLYECKRKPVYTVLLKFWKAIQLHM